ncbi:hypothetical protein DSO57_1010051 [Entomophthora muscae]|uniref:Uncharacterized protein n=1 Tax=Entomophthora muscae TaxID=34485 RepID=A0ACC2TU74_9FUNG|nr:hypothetical protein DSO57_1010051 [Entomophthora muscae]
MFKLVSLLVGISAKIVPFEVNTGDHLVAFRVAIYHHNLLKSAGVLLRSDIVLTTADQHTGNKKKYEVLLNSASPPANLTFSSLSPLAIREKVIHPEFRSYDAPVNNVCIFKLDLPPSPPLRLHGDISDPRMEEMFLHIIGWGFPVEVTTRKPKQCRQALKRHLVHADSEFCFSSSFTHSEAMKYPRGSPLFINSKDSRKQTVILAGLYSWPLRTHTQQVSLVVLKISKFRNWIQETINQF